MTRTLIKFMLLSVLCPLLLASCGNDDESAAAYNFPSYRDGDFSGSQLSVSLNGENIASVSGATMTSTLLSSNTGEDADSTVYISMNPTYTSSVTIEGFPSAGKSFSFVTISDLQGFTGTAEFEGNTYDYVGEFTGDPLSLHSSQGMIVKFTSK